jgi:hypothetical protein
MVVEHKHHFLSAAECHDGKEDVAAAVENAFNLVAELGFAFLARSECINTKGGLNNNEVRGDRGKLGAREVAVGFAAVVTGVKGFEAINIDEEHAGTQDVAGTVGNDLDPFANVDLLLKVEGLDLGQGAVEVGFGEERGGLRFLGATAG